MKTMRLVGIAVVTLFALALPAFAQPPAGGVSFSGSGIGAGLAAGLVLIGAGWGFGRIGQAALESMARQPEVAAKIQTAAIIIAALLEGATFFALLVCIILLGKATF